MMRTERPGNNRARMNGMIQGVFGAGARVRCILLGEWEHFMAEREIPPSCICVHTVRIGGKEGIVGSDAMIRRGWCDW